MSENQSAAWWEKERVLIREVILILVVAIVVGAYFLEQSRSAFHQQQREAMAALAQQVAMAASEFVVASDLLSLSVIATNALSSDVLARVEFRDAADRLLADAGQAVEGSLSLTRPIVTTGQRPVGTIEVWPAARPDTALSGIESRFALIALALVALRLLGEFAWRRLRAEQPSDPEPVLEADLVPLLSLSQTDETPRAWLRVGIVNHDRLKERMVEEAFTEMLHSYGELLEKVAVIYNARLVTGLGDQAALVFSADSRSEAAFQALCAGTLFRRLARDLSEQRRDIARTLLEFKLLVTCQPDLEQSWQLCLAGLPGRVHVLESEMQKLELDTRLLFQGERCLNVLVDQEAVRIQPIEQLAQRYQKLIADQVESLQQATDSHT